MLKKMNDRFYCHLDRETHMLFTYEKGEIGVYSAGDCWRLWVTYANQKSLIACFVTRDDRHRAAEKYSLEGRIWGPAEALTAAKKMVSEFLA